MCSSRPVLLSGVGALICSGVMLAGVTGCGPKTPVETGAVAAGAENAAATHAADVLELHGRTMGTTYSVKCWSSRARQEADADEVQAQVDALLVEVNRQMSTYDPESELSRFNRAPAGEWFAVSPATATVVGEALELHELTEGALDVTIAPVLRLWRFGAGTDGAMGDVQAPNEEELASARKLVGANQLERRAHPPALRKNLDGVEVDLSAIAKGFGVDVVAAELSRLGFENVMVEIGGEVRTSGERPSGGPWQIGVEHPDVERRAIAETIPLRDAAMATSGDYRNYRTASGTLVTHIIDPRTGQAIPFRGMSVTVLASTCMEADGLATALVVLGDDRAYDWCEEHEVAAMFQQLSEDGSLRRRATSGFERITKAVASSAAPPLPLKEVK